MKGKPPFFAKILAIYEDKEGNKKIEGFWFFKPEDTISGRKPFHGLMVTKIM